MEKRTVLAILLCLAVWIIWFQIVLPWKYPPSTRPPRPKPPDAAPGPEKPPSPPPPGDGTTPPVIAAPPAEEDPPPTIIDDLRRETPHFELVFSNRGARLVRLLFLDYKRSDRSGPLELIRELDPAVPSFAVVPAGGDGSLATRPWKIVTDEPQRLGFQTLWDGWLRITKTFVLETGLSFRVECRFENIRKEADSGTPPMFSYNLMGAAGVEPEPNDAPYLQGVRGKAVGSRIVVAADVPVSNVLDKPRAIPAAEAVRWAGSVNKYFASLVVPRGTDDIESVSFSLITDQNAWADRSKQWAREQGAAPDKKVLQDWLVTSGGGNVQAVLQSRSIPLPPGQTHEASFEVFIGPKSPEVLATFEKEGFIGLLDYGWFGFISKLLLGILALFHALIGNYGWAIVLLTIAVRMAIFPLSKKTQVSMYRMQKLQPKMEALRQRYDKEPQKLQQEMFKLYKEHGANPLSGCLPMLLQLPILIALYWALSLAIELRQAPWISWVTDLSQPDDLGALPIPKFPLLLLFGPEINLTRLHLLPIIMIATWCIQQALTPKSPDPAQAQQQKMMMFMPILFGLLMYWTPSGLILYWLTSTVMGIGEQQLIKKVYLPRAELAPAPVPKT
ncbi:MAG: membrane protein insertase YidC [Planctomycetes bacterium]|nr:membrane protein insertase YidC [Planctomycetota bacterium]